MERCSLSMILCAFLSSLFELSAMLLTVAGECLYLLLAAFSISSSSLKERTLSLRLKSVFYYVSYATGSSAYSLSASGICVYCFLGFCSIYTEVYRRLLPSVVVLLLI